MEEAVTRVLILGAGGQIARVATDLFLEEADAELALYLRRAGRLAHCGSGLSRNGTNFHAGPAGVESQMTGGMICG